MFSIQRTVHSTTRTRVVAILALEALSDPCPVASGLEFDVKVYDQAITGSIACARGSFCSYYTYSLFVADIKGHCWALGLSSVYHDKFCS